MANTKKHRYNLVYQSNSGIKWYFNEEHKFVKKSNKIMTFANLSDGRSFFLRYARSNSKTFLHNRNLNNFKLISDGNVTQKAFNINNQPELLTLSMQVNPAQKTLSSIKELLSQQKDILSDDLNSTSNSTTSDDDKPLNPVIKTDDKNATPESILSSITLSEDLPSNISEFIDFLHENHNILILDLEFYQDLESKAKDVQSIFHIEQISGQIFDTVHSFNYRPYNPDNMTAEEQLKFLTATDLPVSQAQLITKDAITKRIDEFIKFYQIDTLISWDNSLDFNILKQDSMFNPFKKLRHLDLSNIVYKSDINNPDTNGHAGLKRECKLYNLKHEGQWHNAYDDVTMIHKLCKRFYYMSSF